MPHSSSNKKLHYFDMPDELKWPSKERNQRLTRGAPISPRMSEFMHLNGPKSPELDEKQKTPKRKDNKYKPEDPKPCGSHGLMASSSEVLTEGENSSKNKIWEDPQNEKPKLLITLTREEIEEDYLAITGRKLPRNVMKRDKTAQRNLDVLFPGLSLEGRNAENLHKKY